MNFVGAKTGLVSFTERGINQRTIGKGVGVVRVELERVIEFLQRKFIILEVITLLAVSAIKFGKIRIDFKSFVKVSSRLLRLA